MSDEFVTIALQRGSKGFYNGKAVEVQGVPEADKLLVFDAASSEAHLISADEFQVHSAQQVSSSEIHEKGQEWDEADRRYAIIKPLIERRDNFQRLTLEEVQKRAVLANVHYTTIYRWIAKYESAGSRPSGLKPKTKNRGSREPRLDPVTESILKTAVQELYLDKQQRTVKSTHRGLDDLCKAAGIKTPHYNTLRQRIARIAPRERLARRARKKLAADTYDPRPGSLVVDRPWQLIEIDHTPADVMLVDSVHRKSIGRPGVTIAIDVYSRMIVGFYVSLERPSAHLAGLCLARAMLPKGAWLAKLNAKADWPCYGRPVAIHADNALEFHGKMLHRACQEHQIRLDFRPLHTPEFGGHIEAFNKTLARKVHELPGTTFFDVEHRGEYESEEKATFSLDEFEKWLVQTIAEYHETFHSGIKCSPKSRYRDAFVAKDGRLPLAQPELFKNPEQLRIEFMPHEERTIQQYGVQFWKIRYYHAVLRRFVNARISNESKKRRFRFHYDPQNISHIYFFDPELKQYLPIPYSNITNPPMSKWECIEADRYLTQLGRSNIDERAIVESVKQRRSIEIEAAAKTKKARRNAERVRSAASAPKLSLVKPLNGVEPRVEQPREVRVLRPYAVEDL